MLQTLPIKKNYINLTCNTPQNTVSKIKSFIEKENCSDITFNISNYNIIDAARIAILCSTYHFVKYKNGTINWIVNSFEVENLVKPLNLNNARFMV